MKDMNCSDKDIWWKNFILLASDGHTLYLTSIPFPSVEQSKKHFELSIKKAEKILRRDSESNSKGEPAGERAFGFFPEITNRKAPSGVPHYQLDVGRKLLGNHRGAFKGCSSLRKKIKRRRHRCRLALALNVPCGRGRDDHH
jgi:hypothetical protein